MRNYKYLFLLYTKYILIRIYYLKIIIKIIISNDVHDECDILSPFILSNELLHSDECDEFGLKTIFLEKYQP